MAPGRPGLPLRRHFVTRLQDQLGAAAGPGAAIARTSWVCGEHGNNMVKLVLRLAVGLLMSDQASMVLVGGVEAWSRAPIRQHRPRHPGRPSAVWVRPVDRHRRSGTGRL